MYGLSDNVNLVFRIPFLHWSQTADEPDAHHRTESVSGFGNVALGVRWLVANRSFGPGHRFFVEADLTLPTAKSYESNPFSENADQVEHRHFALGNGVVSSGVNAQWWVRTEFPWVVGITAQTVFPWYESDLGFLPGRKSFLAVHGIRQAPVLYRSFPYLRLRIQEEQPDRWAGVEAPNSGGVTVAGMVGLDLELSESVAAVVALEFPAWKQVEGFQLDALVFSVSFRHLVHWHGL